MSSYQWTRIAQRYSRQPSPVQHPENNNSTPRYDAEQAKTAWERTVAWFKKFLA